MDCEETIRQVYFYLDGELTAFRRWQITRHLNRCPPCQHGFDFELELRQVVARGCRNDALPPDLKQRIAEALGLFDQAAGEARRRDEESPGGCL
jgi:mycothiol system anti-sigma-R factor